MLNFTRRIMSVLNQFCQDLKPVELCNPKTGESYWRPWGEIKRRAFSNFFVNIQNGNRH